MLDLCLCQIAESVGKIDPGNQTATIALVQLLKLTEDDSIRWRVAESLKKFDGAICLIAAQPIDNLLLQCFSPNQAIADVVDWLIEAVLEV
jgi:hypothetical protein